MPRKKKEIDLLSTVNFSEESDTNESITGGRYSLRDRKRLSTPLRHVPITTPSRKKTTPTISTEPRPTRKRKSMGDIKTTAQSVESKPHPTRRKRVADDDIVHTPHPSTRRSKRGMACLEVIEEVNDELNENDDIVHQLIYEEEEDMNSEKGEEEKKDEKKEVEAKEEIKEEKKKKGMKEEEESQEEEEKKEEQDKKKERNKEKKTKKKEDENEEEDIGESEQDEKESIDIKEVEKEKEIDENDNNLIKDDMNEENNKEEETSEEMNWNIEQEEEQEENGQDISKDKTSLIEEIDNGFLEDLSFRIAPLQATIENGDSEDRLKLKRKLSLELAQLQKKARLNERNLEKFPEEELQKVLSANKKKKLEDSRKRLSTTKGMKLNEKRRTPLTLNSTVKKGHKVKVHLNNDLLLDEEQTSKDSARQFLHNKLYQSSKYKRGPGLYVISRRRKA